ncbi:hypothetical protein GCM10027285_04000 [Oleiagrimonas citrea]|uniref:DUF4124 domain-containing protein n=1 Tax=Oleiagrimonas citrea TaxID=1665687 RepID=A0A846ZPL5_9GAMM|nr:DUF4124 domain-containing protein [Oleiagrimonas citrea]NKZ39439.1 DUF4124 domain-containing protein [Oleiagrimonas citrea]
MPRLALFLLLLTAATFCRAQTAVHRCVSVDGTPVFTDQPCRSMQAARIGAVQPSATPHACPATREALRQRVAAAFAAHDANALAGLMLWEGYDDREAVREIAQMRARMRQPLLGVTDDGAPPPASTSQAPVTVDAPSSTTAAPSSAAELNVHLGGVAAQEAGPLRFRVLFRAGCYWLQP